MSTDLTAFIFARGGSKGVFRKNVRELAGKPLIAHSIQQALACERIGRVVVSTDDEEIASVSREYGAMVPFMRPDELAQDDSPEWLSWRHAIQFVNASSKLPDLETFISIPATSPMRSVEDIDHCLDVFAQGDTDLVLTIREAERHPSFNMVMLDKDGYASLVMPPDKPIYRRQDALPVFDITTVAYIARPDFVLLHAGMFQGRVQTVVVPAMRALDIDTEFDLKFAEFLITQSKY